MTVWEFSSNDFAFKPSCIKQVPSDFPRLKYRDVLTTSDDEALIIVSWDRSDLNFVQLTYDGRDWRFREYLTFRRSSATLGESVKFLTDGHAIFTITTDYGVVTRVKKAPIHSFGGDDCINWEVLNTISCPEFDVRAHERNYFMVLHNQQLYFVHPQGEIFTAYVQPPVVPIISWGNSGVNFQHAPYLVGLPNGAMLMIGMTGKHELQLYEELNTEFDVIKVSQEGNEA